jgi:signal transduction histidine kinase
VPYAPLISIGFLAVSHYLAAAVLVGVVAALLTGFYRVFGRAYLRYWALSWWAFAVHEVAGAASISVSHLGADHPSRLCLSALSMVASALQIVWLLIGTWEVTRGRRLDRRTQGSLIAGAIAFGLLQGLAFSWDPAHAGLRLFVRLGGRQLLVFVSALVAAAWLARASAAKRTLGRRGLPYAFVFWGTFQLAVLALIAAGRSGEPLVFAALTLLDLAVHGVLAVATVAWLLGEERARESERAALEAAVRHGATMAALGTLVGGVAHEVRNPLFGITSTLDALAVRVGDPEELRPHMATLRAEVGRLDALMRDLLDYGRPTTEASARGRLEEVVSEAARATAALAGQRRVRVDCGLQGELPPLFMDRGRMVQVFQNLIDNAVRHTPEGGTVRVRGGVADYAGASWVTCTVDDDGPGFPPGDEAKAFLPFFTRRQGGTGLGLPIVQRIVDQHGGTVEAANHPGGGARLTVRLPFAPR